MFVSGDSSKFFDPLLLLIFYEITRHSFEVCRISNLVLEMVDGAAGGWKPALCVVVSEVFNTGTILLSKVHPVHGPVLLVFWLKPNPNREGVTWTV